MNSPIFFRALLLFTFLMGFARANVPPREHRIYSNAQYNQEGGDLLGTEVEFTISENRVDGRLKIYEGGCADPIPIAGSLAGEKLHVSGQSEAYGRIEITGTVRGNGLNGWLRLEKAQKSERIRLKKIALPHC
ncbi:MAG: hypothetical protein WBM24_10955 [Candidatus Sulfotelmatobacter sp.]